MINRLLNQRLRRVGNVRDLEQEHARDVRRFSLFFIFRFGFFSHSLLVLLHGSYFITIKNPI